MHDKKKGINHSSILIKKNIFLNNIILSINILFVFCSKKRMELSTHKGYDDNLAHGFVTINIKHQPAIEKGLNPQEKREQFLINDPVLTDITTRIKEDERKQDQLKYINTVNEQKELLTRK